MDPDEIGGFCPRCDREFLPGTSACSDCGIPLVGGEPQPDDAVASGGEGVASGPFALGAEWVPRLAGFTVACVATVLLQLVGAVLAIVSDDGVGDDVRHDRVRSLVQIATPSLAAVVLVGALAVAGARLLGDRRWWPRLASFASAAAVSALAVVGAVTDVAWRDDRFGDQIGAQLVARASVLVLTAAAIWLAEPWIVGTEAEKAEA